MKKDLFDQRARAPSGDTSIRAAHDIKPKKKSLKQLVLDSLAIRPMAAFEIALAQKISRRSVQPRTSELVFENPLTGEGLLIKDSGERHTDPETGRSVIVWQLVD